MSVLVKGMKMPKGCWWRDENGSYMECPLFDADHYCSQLRRCTNSIDGNKPHDCPLVEVPPHGRLIDADWTREEIDKDRPGRMYEDAWALTVMDNSPTIIKAEEGSYYGDICDNCVDKDICDAANSCNHNPPITACYGYKEKGTEYESCR